MEEDEEEEDGIHVRFATLRILIRKQGNKLKLVNYKNVMPSM